MLARAWLFGTLYLAGGRVLLGWAQRRRPPDGLIAKPTLIVGAGLIGAHVERRLTSQPELGLRPVGYLDADPPPADMVPDRQAPVLGGPDDLAPCGRQTRARHVVLGFSTAPDRLLIPLVRECELLGLEVSLVPRLFESVNLRVRSSTSAACRCSAFTRSTPRAGGSRSSTRSTGSRPPPCCSCSAPVLACPRARRQAELAGARAVPPAPDRPRRPRVRDAQVPLDDGPQATPRRTRRPTTSSRCAATSAPAASRVRTAARASARFMRRTSLDELPQLINVLRGEMSLVGPRPERPEFVDLFGARIARYDDRHRVKSGITGWAQVHGLRGKTSLRDRVEWDNYYIENWSLWLDLKILLMTFTAFFHRAE